MLNNKKDFVSLLRKVPIEMVLSFRVSFLVKREGREWLMRRLKEGLAYFFSYGDYQFSIGSMREFFGVEQAVEFLRMEHILLHKERLLAL
ncbi:MAG: hypothetical protein HGA67_04205 [Candidatus Yonathbacteria bacterium]|nr:hypothetical protein [Candidatus Yonathbacteria bacterium]